MDPKCSSSRKEPKICGSEMMLRESTPIIEEGTSYSVNNEEISAQTSVLKQNQLFFMATEMAFDAIVMGENNGVITYVNEATLKLLGYTKEDLIGKHVLEFVAVQDRQRALQLSLESVKAGQGYLSQFKAVRKDRSDILIEVTASVIKDQKGNPIGFIDIIRSLEERKKSEEIIQESRNLYQNLFAHLPSGFAFCQMLFDSNGAPDDFVYLEVNSTFESIMRLRREDALGSKATQLIPDRKETNPEMFETYGRVSLTGKPERFEVFFKPRSLWLDIAVYSPKKGYFAAVIDDITKRKEMEKRLGKYSEDLELMVKDQTKKLSEAQETIMKNERLAAIGQLAGMVGHDLRNPLSGIRNAAYFLRKKQTNLIESSVEMLNIIDDAVEYSNKIVNDLLDFSRELHLELEECSPKSLMDYVLLSMKIPNNVKVIDHVENDPLIWVDTNKIERVFKNILKNAFEAMTHGGTLEITSQKRDETIELVFSDTGEGMSEETLAKIFTPLFTTKAQGMGFGLAICKRIVEAHKGTMKVSSIRGKGTSFTINLPIDSHGTFEDTKL
jgi:PAS domain S-box-containing protein